MSSLDKTGFQEMKFLDEMIDQVLNLKRCKSFREYRSSYN
jgi:hypothetical protein